MTGRAITSWTAGSAHLTPLCERTLTPQRLLALPAYLKAQRAIQAHIYSVLSHRGALALLSAAQEQSGRAAYLGTLAGNMSRLHHLAALLDEAGQRGVALVPFKGAALGLTHYGDPGARPMTDLDLMCAERDSVACADLLARQGFSSRARSVARRRPGASHDLAFSLGDVHVELHTRLWHEYAIPAAVEPFLDRSRSAAAQGLSMRVLDPGDHLFIVLMHAVTHGLTTNPLWLMDATLLAAEAVDAWPTVWRRAEEHRSLIPVLAASDVLERLLPGSVPQGRPGRGRAVRSLMRALAPWFMSTEDRLASWRSRVARFLLCPEGVSRLRWLAGKLRVMLDASDD
ncbi:MAG: nucleotidyltransferase family protein [Vicinamibacteria bacterium]|jgi:hypothetical protein|nr:nucleotidyltransferase family protein [Vicinamibacteria bacterium]